MILSLKFGDEDGPFNWLPYRHLGGLQMWGHIAVLGMDRPFGPNGTSPGVIQLLNLSDLSDPVSAGTFRIDHQASSIGVARSATAGSSS